MFPGVLRFTFSPTVLGRLCGSELSLLAIVPAPSALHVVFFFKPLPLPLLTLDHYLSDFVTPSSRPDLNPIVSLGNSVGWLLSPSSLPKGPLTS